MLLRRHQKTRGVKTGSSGEGGFDPGDHTAAEVKAYLADADDDERDRVLAAERAGKGRKSIVGDDEGQDDDHSDGDGPREGVTTSGDLR